MHLPCPRVDMKAAGAQAMRLLLRRVERGQPWARAFRTLDFWIPIGSQCTLMPPMQTVMTERARLLGEVNFRHVRAEIRRRPRTGS